MPKRKGPQIKMEGPCFDCIHCRSVGYTCQSDSGRDVYCDHPDAGGKHIGDSRWKTPGWCPLWTETVLKFLDNLTVAR